MPVPGNPAPLFSFSKVFKWCDVEERDSAGPVLLSSSVLHTERGNEKKCKRRSHSNLFLSQSHTHTPRTHTHTLPPSFPPPLRQAFGSLDTIGDGFIHASEIEAYFKDKAAGHLLVEHMIKTLDTNNDGKVLLSS